MFDRGATRLLLTTNCGYRIPARPAAFPMQVSWSSPTLSRNGDGTLALARPHHLGHRLLRRKPDEHVDMLLHHMPCQDGAAPLPGQRTPHGTTKAPHLAIQRFRAPLREKDHVIFTIPLCVA